MKSFKKLVSLFSFTLLGVSSLFAQDPWHLAVDSVGATPYYGITSASGVLGVVSSAEPLKVGQVILSGVYDSFGRGRVSNFLPAFNLLNTEMEVDGQLIDQANIHNYRQSFDLRYGLFSESFQYKDLLKVQYSYCALRQLPYSVLLNVKVTPLRKLNFVCRNQMQMPSSLHDLKASFNQIQSSTALLSLLTSEAKSPTNKVTIAASDCFLFDETANQPQVTHQMRDNDMHTAAFAKSLQKGQSYSFSIVGSEIASNQYADPLNQAERLTVYARLQGKKQLIEDHKKAWDQLWQSDIVIEGDAQAQQDVHNMLYHLYAFNRAGAANSPSPMGLSGLGYNGHVFWDTELWMYPALLVLHPEMARSMIEYRYRNLDAARKNAFTYGYKGAMYPWESADTGVEETPVWALTGTFEHHITADVAIAAWNYYLVTGDKAWLREKGWPILNETAQFWASRVQADSSGVYDIKNVVAADEWAENIDNNAFTNAAAKTNLEDAVECARLLKQPVPDCWQQIASHLRFSQMADGVTKEFDSYNGQNIKQADVNLLAYPLHVITDRQQIEKDLNYYQNKIPLRGTPAMTQAVFSILHSRLGQPEKALHWFRDAYQPNLLPPFRVVAETKGGTNPYFLTGAGGVLQSVIMGFGGLEISPRGGLVQQKSLLPSGWNRLILKGIGLDKKTFTVTK